MRTASFFRKDVYQVGEKSLLVAPIEGWADLSTLRPVLCVHGHGADASTWESGWVGGDHVQALADSGRYYPFSIDAGGPLTWNNDTATGVGGAIANAYTYLQTLGFATTKVGLFGWSMGGGNSLQWLKNNAAKVAATRVWAPMTNLDYFHGLSADTAEIDTAYSGNYAANSVGHKIFDEYPSWRNHGAIDVMQGTADTTVPPAHATSFVNGVNQPQVRLVSLAGGTHSSLFGLVASSDTVAFFDAGVW